MLWISNFDIFWPITMLTRGGIGDVVLTIGWGMLLYGGLN